jgi:hypothetical protein
MERLVIDGDKIELHQEMTDAKLANILEPLPESEQLETVKVLLEVAVMARSAFTVDLETQTIRQSVDTAQKEMKDYFQKFQKELTDKMLELTRPEDGEFVKTFQSLVAKGFKDLLDPDLREPTESPLFKLRAHVYAAAKGLEEELEPIKQKLGLTSGENAVQRGQSFEDQIAFKLKSLIPSYQDEILGVGDFAESSSGSKKGDILAKLNIPGQRGYHPKIVVEVKTDQAFKSLDQKKTPNRANETKIRKELDAQLALHGANAAIFVLDSNLLNMEYQNSWVQFDDNKLLLVLDLINPDSKYLQLAYAWARWRASLQYEPQTSGISLDTFEGRLRGIQALVNTLSDLKGKISNSTAALNEVGESISTLRKSIDEELVELLREIDPSTELPAD